MYQPEIENELEMSEYEKKRLLNIKRNNDRLISLGLLSPPVPVEVKPKRLTGMKYKKILRHPSRPKLGRIVKKKARMLRNIPANIGKTVRKIISKEVVGKKTAAKSVEKLDMTSGMILQRYNSGSAAAADVKGHQSAISNACNKRIKSHKGYCWQFAAVTRGTHNKVIEIGKTRVRKQFIGEGLNTLEFFYGVVSYKRGGYYCIVYEDGDSEDMT